MIDTEGKVTNNEDAFLLRQRSGLYAIYDVLAAPP